MDISVTEGPDGKPIAHRPDCLEVEVARSTGAMVLTMFECQADPAQLDCALHSCLGVVTREPAR